MKKTLAMALVGVLCISLFAGCKKSEETPATVEPETVAVQQTESSEAEPEETVVYENTGYSDLTGEYIGEELAGQRPVAVMIGNTSDACPEYGIGSADIVYEATVEGGITRLMGIFQDYSSLEKVESIRSCRYYYIDWAMEFDAIYTHYGQEATATEILEREDVDDLNGLDGDLADLTFYRDSNRTEPHNAYTTGQGLVDGIALRNFRTTHENDYTKHYQFAADGETVTLDSGDDAAVVSIPDFTVDVPWFRYDSETGLYTRYQYNEVQNDAITGNPVTFTNVLIQENEWSLMDPENTEHPYLNMETSGDGNGYYMTGGKIIKVTWKKDSQTSPTRYYDESGNEITLNQGKTMVCVVKDLTAVNIYETTDAFDNRNN